jgi:hypothetical protein
MGLDLIKRIVSDKELKIIKRHERELLEAFAGVTIPEPPKENNQKLIIYID